jgi:hypothetical protein
MAGLSGARSSGKGVQTVGAGVEMRGEGVLAPPRGGVGKRCTPHDLPV